MSHIVKLLLFILLIVAVNQTATQYVAHSFGYSAALGSPLYDHYYQPFAWINWSKEYWSQHPAYFKMLFVYIAFGHLAALMLFYIIKLVSGRKARSYDDAHGSARWANYDEIKKLNLLDQPQGAMIGAYKHGKEVKYLSHNGPEHILAFAPTRSGKGVGLVLPTLYSWLQSVVVLDIKGENWELTSGWRKMYANNKVLRFDPTSDKTIDGQKVAARFNPLEEIRIGTPYTVSDVQNIATIIVDPDGKGLNDHWAKTGFALLTTMILHLIYKCKNENTTPSLGMLRSVISDPTKGDVKAVLKEMMEYKHHGDSVDPVVAVGAKEAMNKPDNELGSVVSTVVSNLSLYDDPIVSQNIAKSDFKIDDLMKLDNPLSLYLVIKPSDMNRLRPLVRIILNQILTILVGDMQFENGQQKIEYKHRLLLMLDEFTSIGKLPIFEQALAYMAGYGIKAYIIIQDLTQLYGAYTKEEAILSNCHVRIAYAPNKIETAELLSKMAGTKTFVKEVISESGGKGAMVLNNVSKSYQEVQRPLLTPDECMSLKGAAKDGDGKVKEPGDMLIFIAGSPAIYGKQILYFLDPVYSDRAKVPSPKKSDEILNGEDRVEREKAA